MTEVYLKETRWNNVKVFIINCYEMFLITLGLCLAIYQDDASSFIYMFLIQYLLFFSMKGRGEKAKKQVNISKAIISVILILAIFKFIYMWSLDWVISAVA